MIYSTIIFQVKKDLGLSLKEYILLDAVYHLQVKTGLCYAKSEYYCELLDIGVREVQRLKKTLLEKGLLLVEKKGIKTTDIWNTTYLGLESDKNVASNTTEMSPTSDKNVAHTYNKEIDIENNTGEAEPLKDNATLIPLVIKELESIDPKNKLFYGNKTQREACNFLISEYGLELVLQVIKAIPVLKAKIPYMPSVTTPVELRDKWVKIKDAIGREKAKEPEVVFSPSS